ncbi:hypothetical protein FHG87_000671 [Trinorchestia longiramus]|nr:hypothetical protein FHG87_000671 [Trinorchestia longiramus]
MDEGPANSSFPDYLGAPDKVVPKLVVLQPADDSYNPYSRSHIYSSLFISSLFFFVFFFLLIAAIIQCKRSTRIPHEEFALIPSSPIPGYMTIVHTHRGSRAATTAFQLHPKHGSISSYNSDRAIYHPDVAPPSYLSMTRDTDPPTYKSVQHVSSDRPSTSASRPNTISPTVNETPKKIVNSSNPFLERLHLDTSKTNAKDGRNGVITSLNPFLDNKNERPGLLSETESFTDDEVFYEADSCFPPADQNGQKEEEQGKKLPEKEAER